MKPQPLTPFDHNHYMPVLRCKQAEKLALAELTPSIKAKMTPLIEVPRSLKVSSENPKKPGQRISVPLDPNDPQVPQVLDILLRKVTTDMDAAWGEHAMLLDLQHLNPDWRLPKGVHPVTGCWNYAIAKSLFPPTPIPVVTLSSDLAFRQAVKGILSAASNGILGGDPVDVGLGLRVRREQLEETNFSLHLTTLLHEFALTPSQVDLIIDFGVVDKSGLDLAWTCQHVPFINEWRTYSCVGGSFRKDLSGLEIGEYEFERWEWCAFRDQINSGISLARIPTYGDYATQYAEYAEPVPGARPSASIRYTADDKFVVVRGRALHLGAKYLQYPANAAALCARSEFGTVVSSCAGDIYIEDKALKMLEIEEAGEGTGVPQSWLQASLNRHWTVAVTQLSSLYAS